MFATETHMVGSAILARYATRELVHASLTAADCEFEGFEMSTRSRSPSPTHSEYSAADTPRNRCCADALDDAGDEEPWCTEDSPLLPPRCSRACVAFLKGQLFRQPSVPAPPCAITKSGMLTKEGYWVRTRKLRLFVLDAWGLRYYQPAQGRPQRLKGHVPLNVITDVCAFENEIRIFTPNREYKLVADSALDSFGWLDAMLHNLKLLPNHAGCELPRSLLVASTGVATTCPTSAHAAYCDPPQAPARSFATWLNAQLVGEWPPTQQPINGVCNERALATLHASMYM